MSDPGGWSAPSRVSDIIFDVKIEIIIIENLHLVIHEGILECDLLYLYLASLQNNYVKDNSTTGHYKERG